MVIISKIIKVVIQIGEKNHYQFCEKFVSFCIGLPLVEEYIPLPLKYHLWHVKLKKIA